MKITVSQKRIDTATKRDSQHCMIADSIRDRFKHAQFISVDLQIIKFSVPEVDTRYVFLTPPEVQRAIVAFDQGRPIKPFTFPLSYPVKAEPMQHWPTATKVQQKKAQATYEKKRAAGTLPPKAKRHHAPRERTYGLRALSA